MRPPVAKVPQLSGVGVKADGEGHRKRRRKHEDGQEPAVDAP